MQTVLVAPNFGLGVCNHITATSGTTAVISGREGDFNTIVLSASDKKYVVRTSFHVKLLPEAAKGVENLSLNSAYAVADDSFLALAVSPGVGTFRTLPTIAGGAIKFPSTCAVTAETSDASTWIGIALLSLLSCASFF